MKVTLRKDLGALKSVALEKLDAAMAAQRGAIVGANADIHAHKVLEASRLLRDGPNAVAPVLAHEAVAAGIGRMELAQFVINRHLEQAAKLASVEVLRQSAQQAIRDAATPAEIDAAIAPYLSVS